MASIHITYRAGLKIPASRDFSGSIARKLATCARAVRAHGIWHEIRVLEGRARKRADTATGRWSLSAWLFGVAVRAARAVAEERRIRRDIRELMAMSDRMLKDIGVTRAEIGSAVRYGRD